MSEQEARSLPRCANCGIDIEWGPTIVGAEYYYCCVGCARGGPCSCDYSDLPREPIVLDEPATARGDKPLARFRRR